MHFLYFLVLCYATVPDSVYTYVIITGNINDIKTLAKKLSINVPEKIKKIGQENEYKYNGDTHDKQTDKTNEYQEESKQNHREDVIEELKEFMTDLGQKSATVHELNVPDDSHTKPLVEKASTDILLDDILGKIKQNLLQEILAKSESRKLNGESNPLEGLTQFKSSIVFKDVSNESLENAKVNRRIQNSVHNSVPVKVVNEEIQFETTYEATQDKDLHSKAHSRGQVAQSSESMERNRKETKNVLPVKNKTGKKVTFVKQVIEPANLNQEQSNTFQQLKTQSSLDSQTGMVQQQNLAQQLNMVQEQLNQINMTLQQTLLNQKTAVEGQQSKLEAKEITSEVPKALDEEIVDDEDKSTNIYDEYVFEEEPTPVDNTKELTKVTAASKEVQMTEDELAPTNLQVDNVEELTRVTAAVKETQSGDENDEEQDVTGTVGDNDDETLRIKTENDTLKVKPKANVKIPTINFGAPLKLVLEKTNNFNEEENKEVVKPTEGILRLVRPSGARKVMLL